MVRTNFSAEGTKVLNLVNDLSRGDFSLHIDKEKTSKQDLENHLRDMINNDMLGGRSLYQAFRRNKVEFFEIIEKVVEITISPNTFPGVYRVVGDTFIRNANTGKDEMFQFVIGKAKVTSNVTLQLQAEGKQQGLLSLNSVNCWNLQKAA